LIAFGRPSSRYWRLNPGMTRKRLTQQDKLLIVGAEYSLETGAVDFFDGVPDVG
jgi:hypothetical protein